MKTSVVFLTIGFSLAGCADATRTLMVPTFEERTVSGERAPLVVPPDYRNPTLMPPRRPCSLGNTPGCERAS